MVQLLQDAHLPKQNRRVVTLNPSKQTSSLQKDTLQSRHR
jgi:hypothetical protein